MSRQSTGFGQTTIDGLVHKSTDSAVLFDPDDGSEFWVPRSVCLNGADIDDGDEQITVADWWLKQEGHA